MDDKKFKIDFDKMMIDIFCQIILIIGIFVSGYVTIIILKLSFLFYVTLQMIAEQLNSMVV